MSRDVGSRAGATLKNLAAAANGVEEAPAPTPQLKRKKTGTRDSDIRLSVGIAPRVYHKLVAYTNDLAQQLGLPRIPHVQVIRALLEELETDEALQDKVAARVIQTYEAK